METVTVGRAGELELALRALEPGRVTVLVGPPGVGKSHLARHLAQGWTGEVRWVDVSAHRGDDLLAAVLELRGAGSRSADDVDAAVHRLRSRSGVLLVLDAAEVALPAVRRLLARLAGGGPGPAILCTSTAPPDLEDERLIRLAPLPVPAGAIPAAEVDRWPGVELFLRLARRADPGLRVDDDVLPTVLRLCRTLDGIPLALELAAARLRHLPLAELDRRMDERFRWLRRPGGGEHRHRAIEVALGESHALLDDRQRSVLGVLATLEAPVSLTEAAELLTAHGDGGDDALDTVLELVDRSFVALDDGRYRLLGTIRAFVLAQAPGDAGARAAAAHRRWSLTLLRRDPELRVRHRYPDLLAALDRAIVDGEGEAAAELAWRLAPFWERTGRLPDASGRLLRAEVLVAPASAQRIPLGEALANVALACGRLEEAAERYEAVRRMWAAAGDAAAEAAATNSAGLVSLYLGRIDEAWRRCDESARRFEALGDRRGLGHALAALGLVALARHRPDEAAELFGRAAGRLAAAGAESDTADVLHNLANVELERDDLEAAARAAERAAALRERVGDDRGLGLALGLLALVAARRGRQRDAAELAERGAALLRRSGDLAALAAFSNNQANAARAASEWDAARRWYEQAHQSFTELEDRDAAELVAANLASLARLDGSDDALSRREREVVALLGDGLDNRAIARRLGISIRTVDAHLVHIRSKVGITSRSGLVRWALEHRGAPAG